MQSVYTRLPAEKVVMLGINVMRMKNRSKASGAMESHLPIVLDAKRQ